jgi:alpha-tubulin suppressor-like RCC1 family protein
VNYFGSTCQYRNCSTIPLDSGVSLITSKVSVYGWGSNDNAQLGDGTKIRPSIPISVLINGVDTKVVSLAVGSQHSIALSQDGLVFSWGNNANGQLGDGTQNEKLIPFSVSSLANQIITAISAGNKFNLALVSNGTVLAWGSNSVGQLGDDTQTDRLVPTLVNMTGVLNNKTIIAIAAGDSHSIALSADNKLFSWGHNSVGQVGDGSTGGDRLSPVAISMSGVLTKKIIVAVAAGSFHTIVLSQDGLVFTWGLNDFGQLCDGTTTSRNLPVAVSTNNIIISSVAGGYQFTIAHANDGQLYTCGENSAGQLGDGTFTQRSSLVAVKANNITNAESSIPFAIGANYYISATVTSTNTVFAWGKNNNYQIGDGTTTNHEYPAVVNTTNVLNKPTFTGISTGSTASHMFVSAYTCYPICKSGYADSSCQIPVCFNKTSGMACSGNGTCTAPDRCSCNLGYVGLQCEVWSCGGIYNNNSSVCSTNGTCVAPNLCNCNYGYNGSNCESWKCGGIAMNNSTVCSSNGQCIMPSVCVCKPGYYNDTICGSCATRWFDDVLGNRCSIMVSPNIIISNGGKKAVLWIFNSLFNNNASALCKELTCASVLDTATVSTLGITATCACTYLMGIPAGGQGIEITLGNDATLNPTQNSTLVNLYLGITAVTPVYVPISVALNSSSSLKPTATITAPTSIDYCDILTLNGSLSTSTSGQPLTYAWTSNVTSLNIYLATRNTAIVIIPPSLLPAGQTILFNLTVANYLNDTAQASVSVFKSATYVPIPYVDGPTTYYLTAASSLILTGSYVAPCDAATYNVQYLWKSIRISVPGVIMKDRTLYIPANTLSVMPDRASNEIVFKYMVSVGSSSSSLLITVIIIPRPLQAVIFGGTSRLLSVQSSTTLDGSSSYDPDSTQIASNWTWTCSASNTTSIPCIYGSGTIQGWNSSILSLPANSLVSGQQYFFTMIFSKSNTSSTASVTIIAVTPIVPIVSLEPQQSNTINVDAKAVFRAVATYMNTTSDQFSYQWSVVTSDGSWSSSIPYAQNRTVLVIPPNTLIKGKSYSIQVTVTYPTGVSSFSQQTVSVNNAPQSGQFLISPLSGTALNTNFYFECRQWDTSLSYYFGYYDPLSGGSVIINTNPSFTGIISNVTLPAGIGTNNAVTVFARGYNAQGSWTEMNTSISASPPSTSDISTVAQALQTLLQISDYATADRVVKVLATSVNIEQSSILTTTCPNGCSGNGVCDLITLQCICNGTAKGLDCSLTQAQLEQNQNLRTSLLQSSNIIYNEGVFSSTPQLFKSRAKFVDDISLNYAEINIEATKLIANITTSITQQLAQNYDSDSVSYVASTISNTLQTIKMRNTSTYDTDSTAMLFKTVDNLLYAAVTNKAAGEAPTVIQYSQLSILAYRDFPQFLAGMSFDSRVRNSTRAGITLSLPTSFMIVNSTSNALGNSETLVTASAFDQNVYSSVSNTSATPLFTLNFKGSDGTILPINNLDKPIQFFMPYSININVTNATILQRAVTCNYWDIISLSWNTTGCQATQMSSNGVFCACTHTTDFMSYVHLNFLTFEDFKTLRLNQDNFTTLIVVCVLFVLYVLGMIIILISEAVGRKLAKKATKQRKKAEKIGKFRQVIQGFKDDHIYLSVITRSKEGRHFSRYGRLTVVYCTILTAIMAAAVQKTSDPNTPDVISLLATMVVNVLLTVIPMTILSFLFENTDYQLPPRLLRVFQKSDRVEKIDSGKEYEIQENTSPTTETPQSPTSDTEEPLFTPVVPQSSPKKKKKNVGNTMVSFKEFKSSVLDKGDNIIEKLANLMENVRNKMTWQGIVLLILVSLVYFGLIPVVVICISYWKKVDDDTIHWVIGMLLVLVYPVFMGFRYLVARIKHYKAGNISRWTIGIIPLLIFIFILLFCIASFATVLIIALTVRMEYIDQKRLFVVTGGFGGLILINILWIIILRVKIKKQNDIEILPGDTEEDIQRKKQFREEQRRQSENAAMKVIGKISQAFDKIKELFEDHKLLPWWVFVFNYLLAYAVMATTSVILVFYGIKFESQQPSNTWLQMSTDQEWLLSAFGSLALDVFLKSPLVFMIQVMVLSLCLEILDATVASMIRKKKLTAEELQARAMVEEFIREDHQKHPNQRDSTFVNIAMRRHAL